MLTCTTLGNSLTKSKKLVFPYNHFKTDGITNALDSIIFSTQLLNCINLQICLTSQTQVKHSELLNFIALLPCSVPLDPLFTEGSLPPTAYSVVKDGEYCGEIRVGLTFTPEVTLYCISMILLSVICLILALAFLKQQEQYYLNLMY